MLVRKILNYPTSFIYDYETIVAPIVTEISSEGKMAYLDFSIHTICCEMEAEYASIWMSKHKLMPIQQIPNTSEHVVSGEELDWSRYKIVPTQKKGKSVNCSADGILYEDFGLLLIPMAHRRRKIDLSGAKILVVGYDNFPSDLQTDGKIWSYSVSGCEQESECPDYRLSILYQLACKKREIANGKSVESAYRDDVPLYNDKMALEKELALIEENQRLSEHIADMRRELLKREMGDAK